MSFWSQVRALFPSRPDRDAQIASAIGAFSRGEAELAQRIDYLEIRLHDAERLLISRSKEISDLRAIVTQIGEKAKQGTAVAKSAAELRRFVGANDAD